MEDKMTFEDKIEELKNEYQQIVTPDYLISNGWLDLSLKLPEKGMNPLRLIFARGLVFALVILVLSIGVVGVAQASKPGDLLFGVKVFSEKVAVKAGVNPEISVVRRADDLIDQTKKSSEAAEKASEEYKKTLEQSRWDAEERGDTQNFKQTLAKQEQKFTEAQGEDHDSSELKKAVEETARVQGEVKGDKGTNGRSDEDNNSGSGRDNNGEDRSSGNSQDDDREGD